MIPDKVPKEDVYHAPEELRKEAHVGSYDKYKELYLRSIRSPDGESRPPSTHRWAPGDQAVLHLKLGSACGCRAVGKKMLNINLEVSFDLLQIWGLIIYRGGWWTPSGV